jgi:hypothetical protein
VNEKCTALNRCADRGAEREDCRRIVSYFLAAIMSP